MADPGTFYAAYTDVQQLLNNASIGAAGSTLYSEASLLVACTVSQAKIHLKLGITTMTKLTQAVFIQVLKAIQIDLIHMRILQGVSLNEKNISTSDAITSYWSLMPALTREHNQMLDLILDSMDGSSWTFDTETGNEVST